MSLEADFLESGLELVGNQPLAKYTYMKVGGPAEYFNVAKNSADLVKAIRIAYKNNISFRVIGGASNIVVSDSGFAGLVIKNQTSGFNLNETGRVQVDSGLGLARFIMQTGRQGWGGLENLYGIPGSVGGAVYGNAGAHGVDISDFLIEVELIDSTGQVTSHQKDWLEFDYRSSKLKRDQGNSVILSVTFQLDKVEPNQSLEQIQQHNKWRITHQPVGQPCCGSVFKNPSHGHGDRQNANSAGSLLDQAGAKQLSVGSAHPSEMHANFVVHDGTATASQIRQLFLKMKDLVQQKYGVTLDEEIEYFGEWGE
ncbi:UDP-N-acetylmuramate dehydrogenase [Candidatus Berkelbacteria bacterium]|nr:UDP-N-acetylmuramate dehydrogenase [Candidatus Berkelbacteria bacterium]